MSEPRSVGISLFSEASAQELPPVDVTVTAVRAESSEQSVTVAVVPVWGIAVGWVLAIVLVTQAAKYVLRAAGLKERLGRVRWRRWMYVVPIAVGILLSGLFGAQLGRQFGLSLSVGASLAILGPGSGAAAAFAYDVFRSVVLPLVPAVVAGTIERVTGIELPAAARELQLGEDSEVLP